MPAFWSSTSLLRDTTTIRRKVNEFIIVHRDGSLQSPQLRHKQKHQPGLWSLCPALPSSSSASQQPRFVCRNPMPVKQYYYYYYSGHTINNKLGRDFHPQGQSAAVSMLSFLFFLRSHPSSKHIDHGSSNRYCAITQPRNLFRRTSAPGTRVLWMKS